MPAIAIRERENIIARLASGDFLRDIALDLNVTPAAISQYLAKDKEYTTAREIGAELQLERWQKQIETAEDMLNLARGREGFRAQSWRCEREYPHRWGAKVEHVGQTQPNLQIAIIASDQADVRITGILSNLVAAQQLNENVVDQPKDDAPGPADGDPRGDTLP